MSAAPPPPGGGPPPFPPYWQPSWPGWPNHPPAMAPGAWPPYPPGYPGLPTPPGYPPFSGAPGWAGYQPPPHPAIPYLAGTGDRIGAFLIDAVILLLLSIPVYVLIVVVFFGLASSETTFVATPFIVFPLMLLPILVQMAYVALTEGRTGQSLGKRAIGIRVVKLDGRPIAWHDALIRWICLIVDQQPTLGILGLILVSTRPLKQRVGDLAAGTIVVRAH